MKTLIELRGLKGRLAVLLAVLTLAIGATAWLFYVSERDRIVHDTMGDLVAVAELQARQLAEWRAERSGDARVVCENRHLAEWMGDFLRDPTPERRRDVLEWMSSRQVNYRYESVLLFDEHGALRLSLNRGGEDSTEAVRSAVREALGAREIVFGELHRVEPSNDIDANIAAPLLRRRGGDTVCVGVMVFRIDAEDFLYPYLQSPAIKTKTGESIIVRREGDDVLYLSKLRDRPDAAVLLRKPMSDSLLPAAMAVAGRQGIVEGKDYRGEEVMAALCPIAGSPWFLIAKIDRHEVLAPAYALGRMIAAEAVALILLALVGAGWLWRGRQAAFYRRQYVAESKISRLSRVHAMLSGINQAIVRIRDRQQLLGEACRIAVGDGGFALSSIGLVHRGDDQLEPIVIRQTSANSAWSPVQREEALENNELTQRVVHERKHFVFNRLEPDAPPMQWQVCARQHGFRSAAAFPLRSGTDVLGVISLYSEETNVFDEGEVALLDELSSDLGFAIEVLEARRAQEQTEEKLRGLFESDIIGILFGDVHGNILDANRKFLEVVGYSAEELKAGRMRWVDITPPEYLLAESAKLREARRTGSCPPFEKEYIRKDGSRVPVLVGYTLVGPSREQSVAFVLDLTTQHQAEEKVRQLSRAVEQSPVSIVITDAAGKIEYVNRKFSEATGYSPAEVLGNNPRILKGGSKSKEEYRELWDTISAGREWRGEFINKKKDGSLFTEYASISPVSNGDQRITHFVAVKEDITERKALEERLRQAQKMESIGTLAGGIAHDFNNILGIVLGHASLLEQTGDDRARRASSIQAVQQAVDRGARLVRQILTFARKTEILVEPVNLNEIIGELVRMMQETFPKTISFGADLDPRIGAIEGDRTQLHQTILNLCVNARDAMPSGGSLSVTTRSIGGSVVRAQFPEAAGENYVHVCVADTGSGMDEATRLRIFEPFFTTKDPGKGTGLGLAVVHGIVRSHAGFIAVDSAPGRGAAFHLYFPVPGGGMSVSAAAEEEQCDEPGGKETVLIVEDEEALRDLLTMLLTGKGYTVLTANDGHEGVRLYSEMQKEIAIVVSDIGLPGLDGTGAYRRMREIHPGVKVILASGFLEPKSRADMAAAGVRGFIHKPYSSGEILRKIREVLDAT